MKTRFLHMFLFLMLGLGVQAQVTTSSISGLATDNKKEPLIGATIIAVHVPSGTQYGTVTRVDGRYNLIGLRVGGPYTVTTSYVGYQTKTDENIFLNLGQNYIINPLLEEEGVTLGELIITGSKNNILNDKRTGASTNISTQAINSLPTLSRSIGDFTRLTPQANGRSFGGADNRFNNITLDGSIFNNEFGLSDLPGGQTNSTPISLDAVEQIQVNIAPFDVREGGFTGAGVNAVTRSGTNEFSGSAFYNIRNESLVGTKAKGNTVVTNDFNVNQIGFRLGGPIVKDKIFFFINAESERRDDPATAFLAKRPGENDTNNNPNVSRVLASDLDQLRDFLISKYNYDPGRYENYSLETKSDKATARLDFNLSNKSKLSLRYNFLKSSRDVTASNSGSFQNRSNNGFALNFENSNYVINNDLNSFIAEHNYLGKNFSNKVIAGYTAKRDYRSSRGGVFPLVDILDGNRNYTTFGFEPFTPNNRLDTDTYQFRDDITYYAGRNTWTAGVNIEAFEFRNTFTPTYYGQFVYKSLQDFYNDTDADTTNDPELERYQLTYSNLAGSALPTATTKASQVGFYLQDEIQATDNFKLTAGFRVDLPIFSKTALENSQVAGYTFNDEFGKPLKVSTSILPNTNPLFSPRLGFNWDVKGDRTLQFRGGTGIFSGRPAFVWLSNQVGNNGILTGSIFENKTKKYPFSPDVTKYNGTPNPGQPASSYNIAVTNPDFKFPQVWRTNVAMDKQLPYGIIGSVELMYTKDINNVDYINANLKPASKVLGGVDNRPVYGITNAGNRLNANITDAIYLRNTDQGRSYSGTIKLERPTTDGLTVMAAYNYGNTRDILSAGSIAFSSWRDNLSVNGNNLPDLAYSSNDLRHRIIGAISYRKEYAKNLATQVSIFFQTQNQGRFSYTINGDVNGDQANANDLMFVPNGAGELVFEQYSITVDGQPKVFTVLDQIKAFDAYIDQDDYLKDRRGEYAERNGVLRPLLTNIDLSFVQEIYMNAGGKRNTLQLRADIFNFGNLISNDWGVGDRIVNSSPLQFRSYNANGAPVYRLAAINNELIKSTFIPSSNLGDVWQMQLGVRYIFN
ncbi:MAG: TonB-dependent receptor [Saprospiraceae bacterium]|nr:TonB-dependent receptor [Saprospiraceae bacterium]